MVILPYIIAQNRSLCNSFFRIAICNDLIYNKENKPLEKIMYETFSLGPGITLR